MYKLHTDPNIYQKRASDEKSVITPGKIWMQLAKITN